MAIQLSFGTVLLVSVPFHQSAGAKPRPAIVILDSGDDDFIAAPVTSHTPRPQFDIPILEWKAAGLNVPSTMRIAKMTVLSKRAILRDLGGLSGSDKGTLAVALCSNYCHRLNR